MTTIQEINDKFEKFLSNIDKWDSITNGDDSTTVTTDTGTVPSVAKFFADLVVANAAIQAAAENARDYAEEWAQSASAISVAAGGDGSTDQSAKTWAAIAGAYSAKIFPSVAILELDENLTYTGGSVYSVSTGDIVTVQKGNIAYEVAASGASDHDVVTTGGVKLYVSEDNSDITLEAFFADNTGSTSVNAMLVKAQAKSDDIRLIRGSYLIDSDITLTCNIDQRNGVMSVADGVTVSMPKPETPRRSLFNLAGSGKVKFLTGGNVYPEWWSSGNIIQLALDQTAPGTDILLDGTEYETTGIVIDCDNSIEGGKHNAKRIVGIPAQRYVDADDPGDAGTYNGTVIKLADGAEADLFYINTANDKTFGSGTLAGCLLNANNANQVSTTINAIKVGNIKDYIFEDLFILNSSQDGMNFAGSNNQIKLRGHIEVYNCVRDGIWGGAVGDGQWDADIHLVNNGRNGLYMAAGNLFAKFIFAYFNGDNGVYWASEDAAQLLALRLEDNDNSGFEYRGKNLHINTISASDNGVLEGGTTEQIGLADYGDDLIVDHLHSAYRSGGTITHKQTTLYYCGPGSIPAKIGSVIDEGVDINQVTGAQTLRFDTTRRDLSGTEIGTRRKYRDTWTNHQAVSSTWRALNLPGTYSHAYITGIDSTVNIPSHAAAKLVDDMEIWWTLELTDTEDIVFPAAIFLQEDGSTDMGTLSAQPADTYIFHFKRVEGAWVRQ